MMEAVITETVLGYARHGGDGRDGVEEDCGGMVLVIAVVVDVEQGAIGGCNGDVVENGAASGDGRDDGRGVGGGNCGNGGHSGGKGQSIGDGGGDCVCGGGDSGGGGAHFGG